MKSGPTTTLTKKVTSRSEPVTVGEEKRSSTVLQQSPIRVGYEKGVMVTVTILE